MNSSPFKKALPHLLAFVLIMLVIFAYFTPLFNGKVLKQYDVLQWKATFQEIAQFEKASGERTFWTNSIFAGMPSYLIGATYHGNYTGNILYYISDIFKHPADTIFLLFACFYVLLVAFEVLDLEPMVKNREGAKVLITKEPKIEFENVDFSYPRAEESNCCSSVSSGIKPRFQCFLLAISVLFLGGGGYISTRRVS